MFRYVVMVNDEWIILKNRSYLQFVSYVVVVVVA